MIDLLGGVRVIEKIMKIYIFWIWVIGWMGVIYWDEERGDVCVGIKSLVFDI